MSKAGGWVPLDKGLIKALPKDRPYTHLEAMFSYTVDLECENQWTVKGYSKLWSWSRSKVRKFIEDIKTPEGHSVDTLKTGKRHPIHYIDKGLWEVKDTGKTQERHGEDTPSTPTNNPLILNPKVNTPLPPKGDEDFVSFWRQYPKKDGKGYAIKAWEKAKKNKTLPHIQAVLLAIEREKQSTKWLKDNGQFIPNPATWINGQGWENGAGQGESENDDKYKRFIAKHQSSGLCKGDEPARAGVQGQLTGSDT